MTASDRLAVAPADQRDVSDLDDTVVILVDHNADAGIEVLASGAKAMAISQVINQVARFGTNIVLARLLVPREFGLMTIALVVMAFLDQFRDLGTGIAIIQRRHLTQPLLNAVFFLNTVLGIALGATLLAAAGPITNLVAQDGNPNVLRAFAAITVLAALGQIHHALLRRGMRFKELAVVNVANSVVNGIVSVVLAVLGFGVWSLVIGTLAGALIDTGLVWYLDKWRPSRGLALGSLKSILGFSGNLFGSNLISFFFAQSDKVLVSRVLGAAPLGIYGMATRILTYPLTSIAQVVSEISFPAFARRQDNEAALRDGFVRATAVVALVTFPMMAIVAAVARPAVDTIFGPKWVRLTPLIWILAPIGAIQSATGTTYQLLMAKGQTGVLFRWMIFSSGVSVASYVIGLHWGLVGLCAASAIAIGLLTPINLLIVFRYIDLTLWSFCRPLIPIAFCAAAGAGAALAVDTAVGRVAGSAVVIVVGTITGCVVAGSLTWLLQPQALLDGLTALGRRRGPVSRRTGQHRPLAVSSGVTAEDLVARGDQVRDMRAGRSGRGRHRSAT